MATLLQLINSLIDNISVTDRQEENIKASVANLSKHLIKLENDLFVERTFTSGSWERDTIIRPLNDVDVFAVLSKVDWSDNGIKLPNPQTVLTNFKNYLSDLSDYKDKVSQSRPCVTIKLSDKDFDVLPCFAEPGGGYRIPNSDLSGWTYTFPEQLATEVNIVNKNTNYRLKSLIKVIKYWNRENDKLIPSYHIEETAIEIFTLAKFENYEFAIRKWFNEAVYRLDRTRFRSNSCYTKSNDNVRKIAVKLNEAKSLLDKGENEAAKSIWKEVFGKEFHVADKSEAASFGKALSEGNLKISAKGSLSLVSGNSITKSKGFYGEIPTKENL